MPSVVEDADLMKQRRELEDKKAELERLRTSVRESEARLRQEEKERTSAAKLQARADKAFGEEATRVMTRIAKMTEGGKRALLASIAKDSVLGPMLFDVLSPEEGGEQTKKPVPAAKLKKK